jgi:8-oxo-dGTP diphosphatase
MPENDVFALGILLYMSEVRPLTADAVIASDDQVLLMVRENPPCEGQWVLPGGYVEPAESASQACIREAKEEVGLEVAVDLFIDL